jgi:hypothetical protein
MLLQSNERGTWHKSRSVVNQVKFKCHAEWEFPTKFEHFIFLAPRYWTSRLDQFNSLLPGMALTERTLYPDCLNVREFKSSAYSVNRTTSAIHNPKFRECLQQNPTDFPSRSLTLLLHFRIKLVRPRFLSTILLKSNGSCLPQMWWYHFPRVHYCQLPTTLLPMYTIIAGPDVGLCKVLSVAVRDENGGDCSSFVGGELVCMMLECSTGDAP